jgi:hypothetical protein
MNEKGYVYVLINPSFREDWVKIGKSKRMPDVRSRELFNTAVPLPYEIYATLKTRKYNEAEKFIHQSIDRISDLRINKKREFFNIAPEKAYDILYDIRELLGEEAEVELFGDNVEVETKTTSGRKTKGERFDFYKKGLKDGDIVNFINDSGITAIVTGHRQVLFEEELWYLSPLTKEIYDRKGLTNPSGSYQGPAFFEFNGTKLTERKTIVDNEG